MCTHNRLRFWSIPFVIATITLSPVVVIRHWLWCLLSGLSCRHCCRHSRWQRDDCKDHWNSLGRTLLANRQECIKFVVDVLSGVKVSRRVWVAEYLGEYVGSRADVVHLENAFPAFWGTRRKNHFPYSQEPVLNRTGVVHSWDPSVSAKVYQVVSFLRVLQLTWNFVALNFVAIRGRYSRFRLLR